MIQRTTLLLLAVSFFAAIPTYTLRADEVNDLIETILAASPKERAKASRYQASTAKKKARSGSGKVAQSSRRLLVPDLGIPNSEIFDPAAKFPKNIVGKYIAGPVTLKSIFNKNGEAEIHITSKNMRSFMLYTRDPDVVAAFNGGWGARYTIPRSCPLRIVGIQMPGMYSVRLAYDLDNTAHTIKEHFQDATGGAIDRFMKRVNKAAENLQNAAQP